MTAENRENTPKLYDRELNETLQKEIDSALGDASLLDLIDAAPGSPTASEHPIRKGTVVGIRGDDILVDLGGKSAGILPIKQWGEQPLPAVGDTIEATVQGFDEEEGIIMLSRQDAIMVAAWDSIRVGQIVEGRVVGMNKGGLELKVDGIDAFMPTSQVELFRSDYDISNHLNHRLRCKVSEVRRKERALVVSRRAILEEEAADARTDILSRLEEGQIVQGTVRTIMPYGAFVDIGGVDGLLHISDMGFQRIEDPKQVVTEGQQLELKVLKFDRESEKISLGLKQVMSDPWDGALGKWPTDAVVSGRIVRLMDFGAFVEIEPGVEGLLPISEISYERRIHHPKEVLSEGEMIQLRIISIDPEKKRMSLSLKRMAQDPWIGASIRWATASIVEGTVKKIEAFGAFVEIVPGVEGLIHISELSDGRVRNVSDVLGEGQTVQVKVLSVDEDQRRIGLSLRQAQSAAEESATTDPHISESTPTKPKRKKALRGGLDR